MSIVEHLKFLNNALIQQKVKQTILNKFSRSLMFLLIPGSLSSMTLFRIKVRFTSSINIHAPYLATSDHTYRKGDDEKKFTDLRIVLVRDFFISH